MLDTLGGPARTRKLSAVAVAFAIHAAAFLLALAAGRGPLEEPKEPEIKVIVGPPRAPVRNEGDNQGEKGERIKRRRDRARRKPPRTLPTQVAPPALEPEPEAKEPQSALASPERAGEAEGEGEGGTAGAGEGSGVGEPCPPGERCDGAGAEGPGKVVELDRQRMGLPRALCSPPHPLAPLAAQQYGLEGTVVARFVIAADGSAGGLEVLNRDAPPVFVEAVRAWLTTCTFTPALLDGRPVAVRMLQPFRFRMR